VLTVALNFQTGKNTQMMAGKKVSVNPGRGEGTSAYTRLDYDTEKYFRA
jgi:hypothetical protein